MHAKCGILDFTPTLALAAPGRAMPCHAMPCPPCVKDLIVDGRGNPTLMAGWLAERHAVHRCQIWLQAHSSRDLESHMPMLWACSRRQDTLASCTGTVQQQEGNFNSSSSSSSSDWHPGRALLTTVLRSASKSPARRADWSSQENIKAWKPVSMAPRLTISRTPCWVACRDMVQLAALPYPPY
ncbi:hypothetical protein BP5796_04841 [Coleophoma crateriformis]|uniref:Uncharacterized protein n=1 Tax=Coleophoma crateriformis TaxID=565419 RepID=A0A3D8SAQ6_9HELO|nr:hypothetical protein BP5796_04841 [Coleophoma crateriformis]